MNWALSLLIAGVALASFVLNYPSWRQVKEPGYRLTRGLVRGQSFHRFDRRNNHGDDDSGAVKANSLKGIHPRSSPQGGA